MDCCAVWLAVLALASETSSGCSSTRQPHPPSCQSARRPARGKGGCSKRAARTGAGRAAPS
eukprot:5801545-Prymnesium_polylepis.1